MSYQQDIRDVLTSATAQSGRSATFSVTIARPGTFEMKVVLVTPIASHENVFDLANGLTPRIRKSLQEWVANSLSPAASGSPDTSSKP